MNQTWQEFKAKNVYKTEDGELFVNVNRKFQRFIRGVWKSVKTGKYQHETKTFSYNTKGYKAARKWLENLEGSSDEQS